MGIKLNMIEEAGMNKQTKLWIGLGTAATVIVLIVVLIAAKILMESSDSKPEQTESDYLSFATVEIEQVMKEDSLYTATGTVTIPNMSMYISKFSENVVAGGEIAWNANMEEEIANTFHMVLKSQKELEMVTSKVKVDLASCVKEYQLTREYFEKYGDIPMETFEFSEEQITEYLIREAYQKNLEVLMVE